MTRRLLVGALLVMAVMGLRPVLYASGVEQTWIPGIYDAADLDDALALSSLKAIGGVPSPMVQASDVLISRLAFTHPTDPESPSLVTASSRAPPLL
jgi:hypothetical protein